MRIAIISESIEETNGWGNLTLSFCREFKKRGLDFSVYLPQDNVCEIENELKPHCHFVLPKRHCYFSNILFFKSLFFFSPKIFYGHDILFSLCSSSLSYYAYLAAKKYKIPFVLGAQGTYAVIHFFKMFDRYLFKKVLDSCDYFITPSYFTRNTVLNFYPSEELRKKSIVIHNGVDFNRFAAPPKIYSANNLNFLGVGFLKSRKGFDITIRAFQKVIAKHPQVNYKIIGPGNQDKLKKLARELQIDHNIHFLGELKGQKLVEAFRSSFAYIHTPRCIEWNFEGFGIVYLEANACGLPALGSISGGVPDAIVQGETGMLAMEDDVEGTAEMICKLIENPELYNSISKKAISWAQDHDWTKMIDKHLLVYQDLQKKKRSIL